LLQMLAIAASAITINDAYAGYHKSFAIAFAVIEAIINYLWWSVGIWDPSHRKFSIYYTINYTIAFGLLVISAFVNYSTATVLWWVVLLLNVTPRLTGARTIVRELKQRGEVFSASAALVERFGSFTIIVLAESILAIISGVAEVKDKEPASWLGFILGVVITFLLWSIYFDMTSEQETKKGYSNLQIFIFLHFPLLTSFGVAGACIRVLLEEMEGSRHNEVQWIFCVALASILFLIVAIAAIMRQEEEDLSYIKPVSRLLVITGILILLIPFIGSYLNTVAFFGIITLLLSVPVFIGLRRWVKYKFFSKR